MPLAIRPSAAPDQDLDLTPVLVKAVAEELWRRYGGNDVLNWMEAERFVAGLAAQRPAKSGQPRSRAATRAIRTQSLRREDRVTGPLPIY
jgi:hypothetical protein